MLEVAWLGSVPYDVALGWQEILRDRALDGGPESLLLLEHPAVYTLGRGADPIHLGQAADGAVPIVHTSRGGQVTYHGPGQLVGYPMLDLRRHRPDVGWYVRTLEAVLIATLEALALRGERRPGTPGVWVGDRKIASVGVALRRWCTWHGFALNVACDLGPFRRISPCGLAGVEMTSIEREQGPVEFGGVVDRVREMFVTAFGHDGTAPLDLPIASGTARTAP